MAAHQLVSAGANDAIARRVEEALAIVARAEARGATVRVLGGIAIVVHCNPDMSQGYHREPEDIDLVVSRGGAKVLTEVLAEAGYEANERFNAMHGDKRRIYFGPCGKVDVFVGEFAMCHRTRPRRAARPGYPDDPRRGPPSDEAPGRRAEREGRAGPWPASALTRDRHGSRRSDRWRVHRQHPRRRLGLLAHGPVIAATGSSSWSLRSRARWTPCGTASSPLRSRGASRCARGSVSGGAGTSSPRRCERASVRAERVRA